MVSAFDKSGDLMNLESIRDSNHLVGVVSVSEPPTVEKVWNQSYKFPIERYSNDHLENVYADLKYSSQSQLRSQAINKAKEERVGWWIFAFWICLIPALISVAMFFSPWWVSLIALVYTCYKAIISFLKMVGKIKSTENEKLASEKKALMEHYHFHCEQNPEAFQRLKIENISR